jgi:hypothetical protein
MLFLKIKLKVKINAYTCHIFIGLYGSNDKSYIATIAGGKLVSLKTLQCWG